MCAFETIGQEPATLALRALAWTLSAPERASRLLSLTGLESATLRARADDPEILVATICFLEGYEPDLIACAAALDCRPAALVAARRALEAL